LRQGVTTGQINTRIHRRQKHWPLSKNWKSLKHRKDSYSGSQQDALFLSLIFDIQRYMFRTDLLSIIRSLDTVFTAIGFCCSSHADNLLSLAI